MTSPRTRLREMARHAVQAEISDTAMRLFMTQGYEETTVEQIAAAVGMSGRSVFRYFPTKEEIVIGSMPKIGEQIASVLVTRPTKEPPWEAMRRALDPSLAALADDDGIALARSTLLSSTPALRAAQLQKHAQWTELLARVIAVRLGDDELAARALVGSFLACMDAAVEEWVRSGGEPALGDLLDHALAAVRT